MEPKWQQEIEEILLEEEKVAKDKRYYTLMALASKVRETLPDAINALKQTAEEVKQQRELEVKQDEVTPATLDKLVPLWGSFRISSKPANYLESHHLIKKHLSMWDKACRRVLIRRERLAHLQEIDIADIIIKNEIRLTREAIRYLIYATQSLSLNIISQQYKPPRRNTTKYIRWLETKVKFNGFTGVESVMFWGKFVQYGEIGVRMGKERAQLVFYYPEGEAPEGLEKSILVSSLTKEKPSNG